MKKNRGFTLLELMVVVLIITIIAGIGFSSYTKQVRKSRRAEAKQVLADYALRLEKYRSYNATYTTTLSDINGTANTANNNYTVALATPSGTCTNLTTASSANSFKVTATATATNGQNKDTGCTAIVLQSMCGVVTKTPTDCW